MLRPRNRPLDPSVPKSYAFSFLESHRGQDRKEHKLVLSRQKQNACRHSQTSFDVTLDASKARRTTRISAWYAVAFTPNVNDNLFSSSLVSHHIHLPAITDQCVYYSSPWDQRSITSFRFQVLTFTSTWLHGATSQKILKADNQCLPEGISN
jgi:hypothetical protein